jgi:hypothetical protein
MKTSKTAEPFMIGMSAKQILSLKAIFLPASFPLSAPGIERLQYQALIKSYLIYLGLK